MIPRKTGVLRRISSALTTFEGLPQQPVDSLAHLDGAYDPQSAFISRWHQLLLCALCYELFVIPFLFTFKPRAHLTHTPEAIVFYSCEALFVADLYVKLNTISIKDGSSQSLSLSRRSYLCSTEFVLDAVAIVPLSLFPIAVPGSRMVLELTKLIRATRLPTYLGNLDNLYAKHFALLKLFKLLVSVILLSHAIACVRYSFGYHSDVVDPHHQDHWLPVHSDHDYSVLTHYLRSLFWAFGILTGLYEGELPRNSKQFVFTIFVAICGFAMFTYLCATFFMLSKCESSQSEVSDARINQLKQVLRFHDVPPVVQHKVVEYLRYYYKDAGSSDRQVTEILCQSIARDIQVELVKDVLIHVPLFAACSEQFLVAITRLLERISLPAHSTVFSVGDRGDAMYVIHTGVLDVLSRSGRKLRELRKNGFAGELALFSDLTRSTTVVTATFCVLYKLSRRHAEIVLRGYPGVASTIKLFVQRAVAAAAATKQGEGNDAANSEITTMPRRSSAFGSSFQQLLHRSESIRGSLFRRSGSASSVTPIPANGPVVSANDECRGDRASSSNRAELAGARRKGSDNMRAFYLEYLRSTRVASKRPWWAKLLLKACIDASSPRRIWWIVCLQMVLAYNWVQIPLNLAFPLFVHSTWYMAALNAASDAVLWADMYINFNLSFTLNSETVWEPMRSAPRYFKGGFCFDLLTLIPFSGFSDTTYTYIGRIPRLFRIWRSMDHYREVDQLRPLKGKLRLLVYGALLALLGHIFACMYFSITFIEGFNPEDDSWLPSHDVELRRTSDGRYTDYQDTIYERGDPGVDRIAYMQYFRSLYYATNVLTALGRTIEPESDMEFAAALGFMFSGFFITAIVVDNVQKRFTASAFEEKEFFAIRSRIQLFLRRQNAPFAFHKRANNYLDYWWESHRGAKISQLLSDLPTEYRREVLFQICKPALQTLALLRGIRPHLDDIEVALVDNTEFVLYGPGEAIYGEGEHSHGLFFLLEGNVRLLSTNEPPREVIRGGCFGMKALFVEGETNAYAETALAVSGCTVLFLPRRRLVKLQNIFPAINAALSHLEKRLVDSKLSTKRKIPGRSDRPMDGRFDRWFTSIIDPDSKCVIVWETWLFFLMSFQWFRIIVLICFGIKPSEYPLEDAFMVTAEVCFVLDIYLRSRLGYVHFGNKVMDPKLIRRRYFRSWHFVIDVIAILPLYVVNWLGPSLHMELVNINKLLRLVKVPSHLRALEKRYVKYTNELRLFKLVYYTSIASHVLGSIYFDFASRTSAIYSLASGNQHATNFGANKWLPPASLENATKAEQYFASQFWSFGLMSASTQAELPKTTLQCVFTIVTLTTGFFLFAYVVGNMADVIELGDAENREINEKIGWTRRLLQHFQLSHRVATRLKTYFLFKRFHSITQEHILAQSLPPSLMTDIRLLNLHAMIEKVPFLGGMEGSITRMLVSQFVQRLVLKDEYVFRMGDPGTDMFFVFSGGLQALIPHTYARNSIRLSRRKSSSVGTKNTDEPTFFAILSELGAGDFFGENALLSDAPRSVGILAKTSCILYSLSKHALDAVFELYPHWRKSVQQMAKVHQKQQRLASSTSVQPRKSSIAPISMPVEVIAVERNAVASASCSRWLRVVFLARNGLEPQSAEYIIWIRVLIVATLATAVAVPYCIAFDACGRWDGKHAVIDATEASCFLIFSLDVWIQWRLKQTERSTEFCEGNTHNTYKRHRLVWDVLALLPLEYVAVAMTSTANNGWLRFNRCFKIVNLAHYLGEASRTSVSFESAQMKVVCSGYVLLIHWVACLYLLFAEHAGYGEDWNAWMPSHEVDLTHTSTSVWRLRYLRGLFFAVTAFVKKCRTFTPETMAANIFAILTWFTGLLVMAFVIGEIARLYISFIGHEVVFRKHFIATERSLADWKLSSPLKTRVHTFLSNLWSSHRGLHYQAVLDELPSNLRHETMVEIGGTALKGFQSRVLAPLSLGSTQKLAGHMRAIVAKLRFESYPPGEFVITEGTIPYGVFFVVKGQLAGSIRRGCAVLPLHTITQGSSFGELGVLSFTMSKVSVKTVEASDLLSLDLDSLQAFLQSLPIFARIESTVTQLMHDLRAEHSGTLPTKRTAWSRKLLDTLQTQRAKIALRFPDDNALDAKDGNWKAFLTLLLDVKDPAEACLGSFLPFMEMLLPQGELILDDTPIEQIYRRKSDNVRPERLTFATTRALGIPHRVHVFGRSSTLIRDLIARAPSPSAMRRQLSGEIAHRQRKHAKVAAQPVQETLVEAFTPTDARNTPKH